MITGRPPNTACSGQVRAAARTFRDSAPSAFSTFEFYLLIPHLPVTLAVGWIPLIVSPLLIARVLGTLRYMKNWAGYF
jgi:hypothetical protein